MGVCFKGKKGEGEALELSKTEAQRLEIGLSTTRTLAGVGEHFLSLPLCSLSNHGANLAMNNEFNSMYNESILIIL